jgi:hypothetical protein
MNWMIRSRVDESTYGEEEERICGLGDKARRKETARKT